MSKYIDVSRCEVVVRWGGYDYRIDLGRIPDPLALLDWVHHLSGKSWEHLTPDELGEFVEAVCRCKGWSLGTAP